MNQYNEPEYVKRRIFEFRVNDLHGYLVESITEAPDVALKSLARSILDDDALSIAATVSVMVKNYCTPTDEEIQQEIEE